MSRLHVLVVADDLTGAADSAVAFAERGLPTAVSLDGGIPDAAVVAVDTDTRRADPAVAAAAVRDVVGRARDAGVRTLYKKVDSTLRGNVAAELAAFVAAAGDVLCLFSPSFPATGRTTREGVLLVDGVPLERTEMWRLARQAPPRDVPTLLAATGLAVTPICLADVRGDPAELTARLADRSRAGARVAVCDAETDEDLAALVEAGLRSGARVVWAGSGGLAAALAARLAPGAPGTTGAPSAPGRGAPSRAGRGRVLAVVGSASGRAAAQAEALAAAGLRRTAVDARDLLTADRGPLREVSARLTAALAEEDVLVTVASGEVIGQRDAGRQAATALAELLAPCAAAADTLVLTGGETARALLTAVGAPAFDLLGQLEPGVVHARAHGPTRSWNLVTKAGAFGDEGVLVRALQGLPDGRPARSTEETEDSEESST